MSGSSVYNWIKFPFLEIINAPAIVITSFRTVPCHTEHMKKRGSLKWYLLRGLGQVGLGRQHPGSWWRGAPQRGRRGGAGCVCRPRWAIWSPGQWVLQGGAGSRPPGPWGPKVEVMAPTRDLEPQGPSVSGGQRPTPPGQPGGGRRV